MTDLQGAIRLLYQADWTRLSLSADVRFESDQDLVASRVMARMREKMQPWVSVSPAEISYRGRRAYQLSVAQGGIAQGSDGWLAAALLFYPADVIVDAELGCLLRLISFAADRPASWSELSDINTESAPPGDFRLETPPGTHVTEETGNAFTDAAAVMPGAAGRAIRTAADVARRTNDAVSAARSFLDDLRGRSRS